MPALAAVVRWKGIMLGIIGACAVTVGALAITARAGEIDEGAKVLARLDDEWSAAAATRDGERVGAIYADDAIAYPPGEPAAHGRIAATKIWGAYFADESFRISWKAAHAEVSGPLGITAGPYEATYNGPDGKPVVERGKFLCVWKQQADGSWKAVHDMWNADAK